MRQQQRPTANVRNGSFLPRRPMRKARLLCPRKLPRQAPAIAAVKVKNVVCGTQSDVRSSLDNDQTGDQPRRSKRTDSVEEVREPIGLNAAVTVTSRQIAGLILSQAGFRSGIGISLASLRRFWAVAARRNSSRAPFGPRSRSRSSLRMRLRCAEQHLDLLRSRRDVRPSPRFCPDLAGHVASALVDGERGIFLAGSFGQQRGFNGQGSAITAALAGRGRGAPSYRH